MKRVVIVLFIAMMFFSCFADHPTNLLDPNLIASNHNRMNKDFGNYNELAYYPYTIGLMLWMSEWNAYGMVFYDWYDEWVESMSWEFEYDGDLIDVATMNYEGMAQIMTYTISGGLYIESLTQADLMGTLMDIAHFDYYYNRTQITGYEAQVSDFMGGWMNDERGTYTYSGDDMVEYLTEYWNDDAGEWENDHRFQYEYSDGYITETIEQIWDSQWVNYTKTTNTWQNDWVSEAYHYEWDGSEWIYDYRETLHFDGSDIDYALLEDWDGSTWVNDYKDLYYLYDEDIVEEIIGMEWDGGNWVNDMKTCYVFSSDSNDSEIPILEAQILNFPNPFNPTTTIQFQDFVADEMIELTFYNAKGQVVRSAITGDMTFIWDGTDNLGNTLPSGIYFCVAQAEAKKAIKKIMLIK